MARKKTSRPRPLALILLEGFGVAPANPGNAISEAQPAFFSYLINHYPAITLAASGESVGLEPSRPGSAESGFGAIGTGRPLLTPRLSADQVFETKSYEISAAYIELKRRLSAGGALHLIGAVSGAETMSSLSHLSSLLSIAADCKAPAYVHAILDGVDASPSAGESTISRLEETFAGTGARIATLSGRWYALDRTGHANRTDKAYQAMAAADGARFPTIAAAFETTYAKKIFDEEFPPSVIGDPVPVTEADAVLFFNFRPNGSELLAARFTDAFVMTLTDYGTGVPSLVGSSASEVSLPRIIVNHGLRLLRLADSEAYPDVSAFFDGTSAALEHERRQIVETDADPVHSAAETAKEFAAAVETGEYDVIITAFAQPDRAAHTNQLEPAVEAIRAVDAALESIVTTLLNVGGAALITASHGAAERTIDFSGVGGPHTANPVPMLLVGKRFEGYSLGLPEAIGGDLSLLKPAGSLLDVAPTVLSILGLDQPADMPGRSLI